MRLCLIIILLSFFGLNSIAQSTFIKWINNVDYHEGHRYVYEVAPGKYLCTILQDNLNFNIPNNPFDEITVLYMLNNSGNITDSLYIEKLDEYYIIVNMVISSENNEILLLCNALNENTLDIQLCLLQTDINLNLISYHFYGSPDEEEFIFDFCINNDSNLVLTGSNSFESLEGGYFLWEIDFQGNTLNYFTNDTLSLLFPSILQITGTGNYHVNDIGSVLIHNQFLEYDTILLLENNNVFIDRPQRHKLIDNSHYIKRGLHYVDNGSIPPEDPFDMAFLIINDAYQIEDTFLFGAIDTLDNPGMVDFIDTNRFFFSGVKNYITLPPEDSWICLYITNLNGDTIQSKYYGGYGLYSTSTGLATSDGGYIIVASWFDFHNYIPPVPADYDVFIMKVDENGLLTNTPKNIPFEQTDILVYPNPGEDMLKIESSLKNLCFQMFDISGKLVLEKDFTSSSQINTENLPSGNYFYKIIQNEELVKSGKWIRK